MKTETTNTNTQATCETGKVIPAAPLIFQQIPKAIAEIGAIGKNKRNQQQGFQYRGIDDVYNAVSPVLAK